MFVPSLEITATATATATLQMQTLLSSHLRLHLPLPYPNVALENYTPPSPIPSHSPLQSRGRGLWWRSRGRSATAAAGVTTRRWRRRERDRIAMEAVVSDDGVATSESEVTDPFLEVRNEVADAAGEVVRKYFRTKSFTILDKDDLSPVMTADREAEEAMVSIIFRNFPSHAIYFYILLGVEVEIDCIRRRFLWKNQISTNSGYCLAKWRNICHSKAQDGLARHASVALAVI